jgi:hypothetical protein
MMPRVMLRTPKFAGRSETGPASPALRRHPRVGGTASSDVIPAKAGVHCGWIPACAGMTRNERRGLGEQRRHARAEA